MTDVTSEVQLDTFHIEKLFKEFCFVFSDKSTYMSKLYFTVVFKFLVVNFLNKNLKSIVRDDGKRTKLFVAWS